MDIFTQNYESTIIGELRNLNNFLKQTSQEEREERAFHHGIILGSLFSFLFLFHFVRK
jgi:hypothetical protein